MISKKKKYYAVFLTDIGTIPYIIGRKIFSLDAEQISFKKKAFVILHNFPFYERKNKIFYFFDYETGSQLMYDKLLPQESLVTLEIMDKICNKNIVSQLLKSAETQKDWVMIIISIIAGLGIGLFTGMFF